MKTSSNIFELIKSLTPAEKRYFKVFAKRHVKGDENNYVLLFNAIDKQTDYNEAILLKKIKRGTSVKHFSSEKSYLYKLILKAMNAYDLDKSIEAKIREQIGFITFFQKKRLYQQALKQLDKTKKLAVKYEHYYYLIQILHLEIDIIDKAHQLQYKKRLDNNQIEMQKGLQKINLHHQYRRLHSEAFWKNTKRISSSDQEQITYFQQIIQSKLLSLSPISDFRIQKIHYQTLQLCYLQTHQNLKSYECALKIVDLYESHPHFLKNSVLDYISILGNTIVSCFQLQDWEGMYQIIQKMRKVPTQNINQDILIFEKSYNAETAYYQERKESEKVQKLLIVIEQRLLFYDKKIRQPSLLTWYYNLAGLHFSFRNFNKALELINRFFNLYTTGVREDIYNKAVYLNLLIHWKLDNHRLLESLIRTVERYVRQKNKTYSLELPILAFFRKMLNLPIAASQERLSLLQSLDEKFENLEDKIEKGFWNSFGLIDWLKEQLKNES
ncbi:MAG: hypothetical protein ACPG49_08455 [Chitinophagales bacterium]